MRAEQRREVVSAFEKAKLPRTSQQSSGACDSYSDLSTEANLSILSVSAEDSGISSIPLVTLSAMWDKTSELLSKENGIPAVPGNDPKSRMVVSYSQICSHTIAVAEQNGELMNFLQWYVKSGQTPNLSTVALSGLSRGRGQKGGRQRSKVKTTAPENYSLQPGLVSTTAESASPVPVVQVSECYQPTISVLPESNSASHVNVSGVVQGSLTSQLEQGCRYSHIQEHSLPHSQLVQRYVLPHSHVGKGHELPFEVGQGLGDGPSPYSQVGEVHGLPPPHSQVGQNHPHSFKLDMDVDHPHSLVLDRDVDHPHSLKSDRNMDYPHMLKFCSLKL